MKRMNIIFWTSTILFVAFMLTASIPDIMLTKEATTFMQNLGYPDYFTQFLGVLKFLGLIVILVPGFPRIKEWAYAGFIFDLVGAIYSITAVNGVLASTAIMLIPIILCLISYAYFHKRLNRIGQEMKSN